MIPARVLAKEQGLRTYQEGRSCKLGHKDEWLVLSGRCVTCVTENNARVYKRRCETEPGFLEAHRARSKDWKKDNSDKRRDTSRKWSRANARKIGKKNKEWREKNPIKSRDSKRRTVAKNPGKYRQIFLDWAANNPERAKAAARASKVNRRAKEKGNGGRVTAKEIAILLVAQDGKCFWCDKVMTRPEIDHIVPVAKGGCGNLSNLVLACRTCNASKGNRDAIEWATEKGYA